MSTFLPPVAFNMGWMEWIIVLIVALLLFGKRLPGAARSLGKGITEFKKGLHEGAAEGAAEGDETGSRSQGASGPAPRKGVEDTSV